METLKINLRPHDETTTPTEKLDAVLIWLENNKDDSFSHCGFRMPTKYSNPKSILLTARERDKILEKLEKNGYADMNMQTPEGASGNLPHYSINFDGEVFLQSGGYAANSARILQEDFRQKVALWMSAVGASLAGLYGVYEILKQVIRFLILIDF